MRITGEGKRGGGKGGREGKGVEKNSQLNKNNVSKKEKEKEPYSTVLEDAS